MDKKTPKPQAKKKKAWEVYTKEEKEFYIKEMQTVCDMRDQFRAALIEFDDKTFYQSYEENRKADLAYNPEIENDTDFRVTSGVTREKDTTILSTVLNLGFEPNVTSFKKDNSIIAGLGNEMEDLVKKSREIENWKEKRPSIYREFIAQGEVYVEEMYIERSIRKESDPSWTPTMKIADFVGDTKPIYDIEGKCESILHLGKYVLYSNMNEEELQNNDVFATYKEVDRADAESIFGKWDRWDLVPDYVENDSPFKEGITSRSGSDWNVFKVGKGKVGILKIWKRFSNRHMIMLNGVMMLPTNFPMTKVSPSGLYPVAKGLAERIPNFSKAKGIPSKTRVDQRMYDTFLRAMVGKAWQSYKPALGNRSGNVLSRDIVNPNQITHGIKQNDIFTILPQQLLSVTSGDVSMFEMMKTVIDDKSVSDTFAAQTTDTGTTATEIVNQQKQTMLKLAAIIDGVRSLERRLILLRIYNIIANWTKYDENPLYDETVELVNNIHTITGKTINPLKKGKTYGKHTVDTTLPTGKKGIKMIQFHGPDQPLPSIREHMRMEKAASKLYGQPVQISFINAEWLRELQAIWNVEVVVSSENDDHMQLLMYIDNLGRIADLFGVQVFKQDYVLQRVALKMREDYEKMFSVDPTGQGMAAMLGQVNANNPSAPPAAKNPAQQIVNSRQAQPSKMAAVTQ